MTAPRHRVLVVDDEAHVRGFLHDALATHGYDVVTAGTAVIALETAREHRPDVILLDLYMPGALTGAEVMQALAAFAPVIVVTGSTDEELGRRLLAEGAFDYVIKPFDLTRIVDLVSAAIAFGRGP